MATKVPMATTVPMVTKVPMATTVPTVTKVPMETVVSKVPMATKVFYFSSYIVVAILRTFAYLL